MKLAAGLLRLLALASLAGCAGGDRTDWAADHDRLAREGDSDLAVLYDPATDWGRPLAPQFLEFLREGRRIAATQLGLQSDVAVHVLLREWPKDAGNQEFEFFTRREAQTGAVVWVLPGPVPASDRLASDLAAGETLRDSEAGVLPAARLMALLDVHEMLHVHLSCSMGPGATHLWLNEGLAEFLAFRTGRSLSAKGAAGWLRERLRRLERFPKDATLDFLRWSAPSEGSQTFVASYVRGERPVAVEYEYGDPASLRAAAGEFRSLGRKEPAEAAAFGARAAILEEMADVITSPPAEHELLVTSDDDDSRFDVYAVLLAFMIELEEQEVDLAKWLSQVIAGAEPGTAMDADGNPFPAAELRLTNREILGLLSALAGRDRSERARRYPVADAIGVLGRAIADIEGGGK